MHICSVLTRIDANGFFEEAAKVSFILEAKFKGNVLVSAVSMDSKPSGLLQ